MEIKRDIYLIQLVNARQNGFIKVVTGQHRDFIPTFENETGLTLPDIINKVYREPLPNRFLASLAPSSSRI